MRGYYVIPTDSEPIEVIGKNARKRAIAIAKKIIIEQSDNNLIVQKFDDNNEDGYMCDLECLFVNQII